MSTCVTEFCVNPPSGWSATVDSATFGACVACLNGVSVIPSCPAATIRRAQASGFGTCSGCGVYGLADVEEDISGAPLVVEGRLAIYCLDSRRVDCRYPGGVPAGIHG